VVHLAYKEKLFLCIMKKLKGGTKMEKKYIAGIFAIAVVAVLGVSMVSAFGLGNGFMNHDKALTDAEKTAMEQERTAMQTALENEDYAAWKSLMEAQIAKMQAEITEENFNALVEQHAQMSEMKADMDALREKYGIDDKQPMRGDKPKFNPNLD
jgi:hypothetical protein